MIDKHQETTSCTKSNTGAAKAFKRATKLEQGSVRQSKLKKLGKLIGLYRYSDI